MHSITRMVLSVVCASILFASNAFADPATGWVVTNWAGGDPATVSVVDAHTNAPSFTPANGISVVAGFPTITLNDGDIIHGSGTMTVAGADGNHFIQFRLGLFNEAGSGPAMGDGAGYAGFAISNAGGLQETNGPTNPFSSTGAIAIANVDEHGTTLDAADFVADFSLQIMRVADGLDIDGSITVTQGDTYFATFTVDDYLPTYTDFSFDRIGFLSAFLASANNIQLSDVDVTVTRAVPEPGAITMLTLLLAITAGQRSGRSCFAGCLLAKTAA